MRGATLRLTLGAVARNGRLARALGAFLLVVFAEYGQWVAMTVYAFDRGGASQAGLVAVIQMLPAMLLAPVIEANFARYGVARVVASVDALGAASLIAGGAAMLAGAPSYAVYALAIVFAISIGVARAQQHVLSTVVVTHADELTAANVGGGWSEGIGALAGPLAAGVLIAAGGPGAACVVIGVVFAIASPFVAQLHEERTAEEIEEGGALSPAGEEGGLRELAQAARVISTEPTTRALAAFPAAAAAVEGAIDILVVVLAVQILQIGQGAAGYLSAAFGLGGLVGSLVAVLLVGRKMGFPLAGATLFGGAALAALALVSTTLAAIALLFVVGGALTIQRIAATTLLQRSTPLDVIACVFSLIESTRDLGMIIGAVVAPLLISIGGTSAAFVGVAAIAPLAVLALARRIRSVDEHASIPIVQMGSLRNLPIFAALPIAPLETMAREALYVRVAAGEPVIEEGDVGDAFYAITDGELAVTHDGREVRRMRRGEGFGEIALLHSVPRTTSVTALSPATLLQVGREPFLTALGAHTDVSAAARRVAERRMRATAL